MRGTVPPGGSVAVAVVPVAAGLGVDYTDADRFASGFHRAMLVSAALLAAGGLLSAVLIRRPGRVAPEEPPRPAAPEELRLPECVHCGVTGPQLHPRADAR
jgi:hypothetical protein